jgi:hypothetical protein
VGLIVPPITSLPLVRVRLPFAIVIPPPTPDKFSVFAVVPFNVIVVNVGCVTVATVKDGLVPVTDVFNPPAIAIDEAGLELVMERLVPAPFVIEMPVPEVKFVAIVGLSKVPPIVMPEFVIPPPSATDVTAFPVSVTAPPEVEALIPVPEAVTDSTALPTSATAPPVVVALIPVPEADTDSTALPTSAKSPPITEALTPVPVKDVDTTAFPTSDTAPPVVVALMPVPEADTEVIPLPDETTLQLGASVVGITLRLGCSAWYAVVLYVAMFPVW